MGYQCEIVLCLSPDGQEVFNKRAREIAEKLPAEEFKAFTEFLANPTERLYAEGATLRFWFRHTWHKGMPEWRIMHDITDFIDPSQMLFYSVGQDLDDIERQGLYHDNPFNLHLVRAISFVAPAKNVPSA